MRNLSKTKLLAYRQCRKRLWLEIHRPELRSDSTATQASFAVGNQVGEIARQLYDPKGRGALIDPKLEGFDTALARSMVLLASSKPIFEAGFAADGALAFADVMLPVRRGGKRAWRMVEVKSSTSVKDYHRDDACIQAYVAQTAGVPLAGIALAHIDSDWVYPGGSDYDGLLVEHDLTAEAFGRAEEVKAWIAEAQTTSRRRTAPKQGTGNHCADPYECGFLAHCQSQESKTEYPVQWLPRVQNKALKALIENDGLRDMRHVPDELLNAKQLRVKKHSLSGKPFFDATNAAAALAPLKAPFYFLDFETIQFAVPIWKGTRPFQQIPFQFSVHHLSRTGKLRSEAFLDLTGKDPSKPFAEALIASCGARGPVFVYNAAFEKTRIKELAVRFPKINSALLAINERVVDLLPVAEQHYYHPSQQGSWSIKKVLPAIAPDLRYEALDGVQNGGMAMTAYMEAISPKTSSARREKIRQQLLDYCGLDTFAMVRLWRFFTGAQEAE